MEIPPLPPTGPCGDSSPARVGERPGFAIRSARGRLCHEACAFVSLGPPVLALAAMLAFSVASTHDYLAWNAARWTALGTLERSGITSRQIDGGLEYNALRGYDPRFVPVRGKGWWWVSDDEFVVGLGPLPGYDIVRRLPFARWMPPGQGDVVTLRRHGVAASGGPVTRDRPEWSNQWP